VVVVLVTFDDLKTRRAATVPAGSSLPGADRVPHGRPDHGPLITARSHIRGLR